jgi:hypothetical protein
LDDLGAQGEPPSHPELLDDLARRLVESGWNVKELIRGILLSQTYQRSYLVSTEDSTKDSDNRWLARQRRFRLDAELVRDNALAISGLLVRDVGGASVKPYQPPGYWAYLNFPTREWSNGSGKDIYRRGLYTHWQRQYLHPSLLAFDAPCREECSADRTRSSTPLQSLVLLNDPTYLEAARAFAAQIILQGGKSDEDRCSYAIRQALSRAIHPEEERILSELKDRSYKEYIAQTEQAKRVLSIGQYTVGAPIEEPELAAWTAVARAILNLHETITRN